ncbi:MAG: winged helix-turn-helix transcriptional regulator, partial [Mesorhizobium sp.]
KLYNAEGVEIAITAMEFRLLKVFSEHRGRVLNRDQLLELAHDRGWDPFDRSIDIRVSRLRKKIEVDPSKPEAGVQAKPAFSTPVLRAAAAGLRGCDTFPAPTTTPAPERGSEPFDAEKVRRSHPRVLEARIHLFGVRCSAGPAENLAQAPQRPGVVRRLLQDVLEG